MFYSMKNIHPSKNLFLFLKGSLLTSGEHATLTDGTVLLGVHLLHTKCHIPISFK